MTGIERMTAEEIRHEAMLAVRERRGVVGTVRFLQQFNQPGRDYTADRAGWADNLTQEEIVAGRERLREKHAENRDRNR